MTLQNNNIQKSSKVSSLSQPSFKPTNSPLTTWKAISRNFINLEQHPFHMVDPSPWPFAISFSLYFLACTLNLVFNFGLSSPLDIFLSFSITLFIIFCWINDVVTESTFFGHHTKKVFFGLVSGLSYFIVSELFLFVSIFWAFFHLSLTPSIFIGASWPPIGLENVETFLLPLANTVILAFSGIALTLVHGILVTEMFNPYKTLEFIKNFHNNPFISFLVLRSSKSLKGFSLVKSVYFYPTYRYAIIQEFLAVTLFFALWFTYLQYVEYCGTSFAINDTALGTIFFFSTGFHGVHVIFGACMLLIQALLIEQSRVFTDQLIGFEFATIYWHFVDVVWLGLFIVIYGWVQGEQNLPATSTANPHVRVIQNSCIFTLQDVWELIGETQQREAIDMLERAYQAHLDECTALEIKQREEELEEERLTQEALELNPHLNSISSRLRTIFNILLPEAEKLIDKCPEAYQRAIHHHIAKLAAHEYETREALGAVHEKISSKENFNRSDFEELKLAVHNELDALTALEDFLKKAAKGSEKLDPEDFQK